MFTQNRLLMLAVIILALVPLTITQTTILGCLKMETNTTCKTCNADYNWKLKSGKCQCSDGYSNPPGCTACLKPYSPKKDSSSSSGQYGKKCQKLKAKWDTKKMIKCGFCPSCGSSLGFQQSSLPLVCQCKDGFYKNGIKCELCSSKISGCFKCSNQSKCLSCLTATHFWNTTLNQCRPCSDIEGCDYCSSETICTTCETGYVKVGTICIACNSSISGCSTCRPGIFCSSCNTTGHFYSFAGRCLCSDGYYNRSGICLTCVQAYPGCVECQITSTGSDFCKICDADNYFVKIGTQCQCLPGYLLNVDQCVLCNFTVTGCLSCSEVLGCTACDQTLNFNQLPDLIIGQCTCKNGFGKNDNNQCQPCQNFMPGCALCSGNPIICDSCQITKGYFNDLFGITQSCLPCEVPGCSDCHLFINKCLLCDTPLYQTSIIVDDQNCGACLSIATKNDDQLCTPCGAIFSQGCQTCNDVQCITCFPGYHIYSNIFSKNDCQQCHYSVDGCQLCDLNGQCIQCDVSKNFTILLSIPPYVTCKCLDNYGPDGLVCSKCNQKNIQHCFQCTGMNAAECTLCQQGYFLNLSCFQCKDVLNGGIDHCQLCFFLTPTNLKCTQCISGYYLDGITCQLCNSVCDKCNSNGYCTLCKTTQGFNFKSIPNNPGAFNYQCICQVGYTRPPSGENCILKCNDLSPGCATCFYNNLNILVCNQCNGTLFYTTPATSDGKCYCMPYQHAIKNGICQLCKQVVPHCSQCLPWAWGQCTKCFDGYYAHSLRTHCVQCDIGCHRCTNNGDLFCQIPKVSYFLTNHIPAILKKCSNVYPNCYACDYSKCSNCTSKQYALNMTSQLQCQYCSNYQIENSGMMGCILCQNSSYCTHCNIDANFMPNGHGRCVCKDATATDGSVCMGCDLFMPNCTDCTDNNTCISCSIGYQINYTTNHCEQCSVGCLSCDPDIGCFGCDNSSKFVLNQTDKTCTCQLGYVLYTDKICRTFCGDGIFMSVQQDCDDGNIINGDGCSFDCKIQANWSCSNQQLMKSTCGFEGVMNISIQKITKSPFQNQITLTFEVGPNIQGLQTINFTSAFSSNLNLSNPSYIYNSDGTVSLTYDYSDHLQGQNAQFIFDPSSASSAFYAVTPINTTIKMTTNNNQPLTFYRSQTYSQVPKFKSALLGGEVISYVILLGGIFCNKIIGIQLFGVWQVAFFSMSNIDNIQPLLSPLLNFKTVNGYNFDYCRDCKQVPIRIKAINYESQISNNFNVMFLLMVVQALIAGIIMIVSILIQVLNEKLANISKRMFKQYLLMITLFNTLNIGYSIGIQVSYGISRSLDVIISIISILFLIGSIIGLTLTEKQQYSEFQNYLRRDWMSQYYFQFTILYRFILGILMSQLNQISTVTVFAFFISIAFVMYQMDNTPFKKGYHNYRAIIHQFSAVSIIGVSMFYRSMKSNQSIAVSSTFLTPAYFQIICLYSCIILSAGVLFYQLYSKYFKQWILILVEYLKNNSGNQIKNIQSQIANDIQNAQDKSSIVWMDQ